MIKLLDDHLEEVLLAALLTAMSLLIGAQVFMRYVMQNSLTWSEELARYCFIWATYIGVSYGVKERAHICVTAVKDLFSERIRVLIGIFSYLIFGAFAVLVIWESWFLAMKIFKFGQQSSSLGIPMGWIYLAPTVGFGLVLVRLLQQIFFEFKHLQEAE